MDVALIPADDETSAPWWQSLGQGSEPALIVARIPFLLGSLALPSAYVVARITPEPTGQDRSLLAFTGSVFQAAHDIAKAVPNATPIAERVDGEIHHVLAAIHGLITKDQTLPDNARFVGAYALPQASEFQS